jgi:hypothetical protein
MNQKAVIYIILSALLLYLYYRSRDLYVFTAFAVLVGVTLMSPAYFSNGVEGFAADKECNKLGFTEPKLVKSDFSGSLEKEIKKIKKVADKYWPYDDKMDSKDESDKKSMKEFYEVFMKEATKQNDDSKKGEDFINICRELYNQVHKSKQQIEVDVKPGLFKPYISGGNIVLKILNNVGKSSEIKDAGAKKIATYLTCLCKHWIAILKKAEDVASDSSGGASGGDDKEKSKNKKTKNANKNKKKKSSKKDAEDDDAEDDDEDAEDE